MLLAGAGDWGVKGRGWGLRRGGVHGAMPPMFITFIEVERTSNQGLEPPLKTILEVGLAVGP